MELRNYLILGASGLFILIFVAIFSKNFALREPPTTQKNNFSATPTSQEKVSLLLTGDVMLGRSVMEKSLNLGDPFYAFRKVYQKLLSSDIVFINLENPILGDCPKNISGFKFCTSPALAEGLSFSGVDVVNLANNHSRDYGQRGLNETKNFLRDHLVEVTGLGNLSILERGGSRFGFLGFDLTSRDISEDDLFLVRESRKKVDTLVVGVHWGEEYTKNPTVLQRRWARQIIEAGADVIAGHHPHWVQGIGCFSRDLSERYIDTDRIYFEKCAQDKKVVYYSLGNFVFDQMWSEETRRGIVVELEFRGGQIKNQKVLKTFIKNWAQPEFAEN